MLWFLEVDVDGHFKESYRIFFVLGFSEIKVRTIVIIITIIIVVVDALIVGFHYVDITRTSPELSAE